MTRSHRPSHLMLLAAAAVWGFAFVAQRVGMDHLGPLAFNGVRFVLGTLVLVPLVAWERRRPLAVRPPGAPGTRRALGPGVVAGVLLCGGSTLQQWGLVWTTAGKAGFITGLYVVFVPLLGLLWGQRTARGAWLGAGLAAAGLYLLSARGLTGIAPGDGLVLAGALFWAGHVQWVGRWAGAVPPFALAAVQFGVCALLSLAGALLLETWSAADVRAAAVPILYAGVMSVGVAYTLQVLGQRRARPAPAAVILSLEAVFAALGGVVLLGESLPPRGWAGCALMLAGVLVSTLLPALGARPRRAPAPRSPGSAG